jgi:hypothetical protein
MNPTHMTPALVCGSFVTLALLLIPQGCGAETAAAPAIETRWTCWYNGRTSVLCRVTDAPLAQPPLDPAASPPSDGLPEVARVILERPGLLRGHTLTIPLHSPPEEMANAELLAEALMCGARTSCRVDFFRDVAALAMQFEEDPARD